MPSGGDGCFATMQRKWWESQALVPRYNTHPTCALLGGFRMLPGTAPMQTPSPKLPAGTLQFEETTAKSGLNPLVTMRFPCSGDLERTGRIAILMQELAVLS